MQRVVITGAGIVSVLGNDLPQVSQALQQGQSGLTFNPTYAKIGMKACVSGSIDDSGLDTQMIDRRLKRFLSKSSLYAYVATLKALEHANLSLETIANNPKVGVVVGSGGASTLDVVAVADAMRSQGLRGVGAMAVPKTMSSSVSAILATGLKITGLSYSIASACATSSHCIGHAMELIQLGKQDVVIAGGAELEDWTQSCMFDGMGAMSRHFNDTPQKASRPYDSQRDGFVIAGGSGIVILESLEHAQARGAHILAELVGYAATSDGMDMVSPSGDGAVRCMQMALSQANLTQVDYINSHGTSTPIGDISELKAIAKVFANPPAISSTKSMTGHSLGATGAQELIYCLLMMNENFIAPSINIDNLDEQAKNFDIVQTMRPATLQTIMSNSFGFGGTNACLIIQKYQN